jgi:hydroxymethylbilane synthase
MSGPLRIGTRGSALALVQAEKVRGALAARFPGLEVEILAIGTRGDRILDSPLSKIGGKGLFIREIEDALAEGRIDLAVHSLKDLPTVLPPGLTLGGVLPREDPRDALVSRDGRGLAELRPGQRVGTSSLRRRAQLLAASPGLRVVDARGNVDTRLARLRQGRYEALVLAACGLQRAGFGGRITEHLDPQLMLPAACQGIIGMEVRSEDRRVAELAASVSHGPTMAVAEAERAFMHRLEWGCRVPAGCLAVVRGVEGKVSGMVADPEGGRIVRLHRSGPSAALRRLAEELARGILSRGGAEILAAVRDERAE